MNSTTVHMAYTQSAVQHNSYRTPLTYVLLKVTESRSCGS